MAWIAVDADNSVYLYEFKPEKGFSAWNVDTCGGIYSEIDRGFDIILIGKTLTWKDEPVEI